jgi:hypothetical protein
LLVSPVASQCVVGLCVVGLCVASLCVASLCAKDILCAKDTWQLPHPDPVNANKLKNTLSGEAMCCGNRPWRYSVLIARTDIPHALS